MIFDSAITRNIPFHRRTASQPERHCRPDVPDGNVPRGPLELLYPFTIQEWTAGESAPYERSYRCVIPLASTDVDDVTRAAEAGQRAADRFISNDIRARYKDAVPSRPPAAARPDLPDGSRAGVHSRRASVHDRRPDLHSKRPRGFSDASTEALKRPLERKRARANTLPPTPPKTVAFATRPEQRTLPDIDWEIELVDAHDTKRQAEARVRHLVRHGPFERGSDAALDLSAADFALEQAKGRLAHAWRSYKVVFPQS